MTRPEHRRFDILDLTPPQVDAVSRRLGGDGPPVPFQDWGSADRVQLLRHAVIVGGWMTQDEVDAMSIRDLMDLVAVDADPTPPRSESGS